jgi:hypothetical protein
MALQYGVGLRNAKMDAINGHLGATATLKIFTGAVPGNCAAADPAGLLCTITLPATPFTAASSGAVTKNGTWSGTASGTGTAASFRIYTSGAVCSGQGNVTTDLVLNNVSIASGQPVEVTTFTLTAGNS